MVARVIGMKSCKECLWYGKDLDGDPLCMNYHQDDVYLTSRNPDDKACDHYSDWQQYIEGLKTRYEDEEVF